MTFDIRTIDGSVAVTHNGARTYAKGAGWYPEWSYSRSVHITILPRIARETRQPAYLFCADDSVKVYRPDGTCKTHRPKSDEARDLWRRFIAARETESAA